jgi:hypothetical protein
LQDHALTGESEMSPTRMKAIEILLRKSIPDLSSIQLDAVMSGQVDHNLTVTFRDAN